MPTVQKAQRQVAATPLPSARLSAAETPLSQGAGLFEAKAGVNMAVAQVGAEAVKVGATLEYRYGVEQRRLAEEAKQRAIAHDVIAADTQLSDAINETWYSQDGYFQKSLGRESLKLHDVAGQWFDTTSGAIAEGLATPEAKAKFEAIRAQRWESLTMGVSRHTDAEMKALIEHDATAAEVSAEQMAITLATTPTEAAVHVDRGLDSIKTFGQQRGFTPEVIAAQQTAFRQRVAVGSVKALIAAEQPEQAQHYAAEGIEQGLIVGDAKTDVLNLVDAASTLKQSQAETARILAQFPKDEAAARAAAKTIPNAKIQQETLGQIEHEFAVQKQATEATREANLRTIATFLDKTPNITKLRQAHPDLWNDLEAGQREGFKNYVKRIVDGEDTNDESLYLRLRSQAVSNDPAEAAKFLKLNLTDYIHRLGKSQIEALTDIQSAGIVAVRTGERKRLDGLTDGIRTNDQIVNDILTGAKIDPSPKPTDAIAPFVTAYHAELDRQVEALGVEKPTNEQIRAIATDLLQREVLKPAGRFVGAAVTRTFAERAHQIPDAEYRDIVQSLYATKQPVTAQRIWNLYVLHHPETAGAPPPKPPAPLLATPPAPSASPERSFGNPD